MKTIPLVSAVSLSLVCSLFSQQAPSAEAEAITFSEHVAPIIFNNCAVCHRPGQAGPFSLLNYRDARRRGTMIARVTQSGFMPPWHPVKGHGDFTDSLALEHRVKLFTREARMNLQEIVPCSMLVLDHADRPVRAGDTAAVQGGP